jgi:hypothetical protein
VPEGTETQFMSPPHVVPPSVSMYPRVSLCVFRFRNAHVNAQRGVHLRTYRENMSVRIRIKSESNQNQAIVGLEFKFSLFLGSAF